MTDGREHPLHQVTPPFGHHEKNPSFGIVFHSARSEAFRSPCPRNSILQLHTLQEFGVAGLRRRSYDPREVDPLDFKFGVQEPLRQLAVVGQ